MQRWNPNQPPEDGLPPQEVRFVDLRAEPWPEDSSRVRVTLEVTPFIERPNLHVTIEDTTGKEVSGISIIESIDTRMTFTMHIRGETLDEMYTLAAHLQYPEVGIVDQNRLEFRINKPAI